MPRALSRMLQKQIKRTVSKKEYHQNRAHQKILKNNSRPMSFYNAEKSFSTCHKLGIKALVILLVGLPGETENSIKSIDILKMDIQGGELAALKGAQQLLENRGIACIYTEAYFIEQYEAQPLFHDISKFLYSYDFTLQDIYTPIYGKGNMAWGDAIFVLKGK